MTRSKVIALQWFVVAFLLVFLAGCGEKKSLVREKLEIICKNDLDSIAAGLPKISLADAPYYSVKSYKDYTDGKYSEMALVEFYFFKTIKAKIIRKYRYLKEAELWDRYFNVYSLINDSLSSSPR